MFSVARLLSAGYILGLTFASFLLLRPNMSHGQFPGGIMGVGGMGGGIMGVSGQGMGGGMTGMGGGNANLLQLQSQLAAEFGAIPVNGIAGGISMGGGQGMGGGISMGGGQGMGGGMMGIGGQGMGGGMMGMGGQGMGGGMRGRRGMSGGMGMGGMMGMGGGMGGSNASLIQLQSQLAAEFGAVPVNGIGGMSGFAGKFMGGFNGGHGF